jgi:thioredoxin:protein disulfide reductase
MNRSRWVLMSLASLVLQAGPGFDPVKDVSVTVSQGVLSVAVPKGVHLKAHLLRVVLVSGGTLRLGILPPATEHDEAGDPIWHGTVKVPLSGQGLDDPTRLLITYQPCTEGPDGMCYLPVKRPLAVSSAEIPQD